jgi:hypothetical protein
MTYRRQNFVKEVGIYACLESARVSRTYPKGTLLQTNRYFSAHTVLIRRAHNIDKMVLLDARELSSMTPVLLDSAGGSNMKRSLHSPSKCGSISETVDHSAARRHRRNG